MIGTRRAIVAEYFGSTEVVAYLPWTAPDPTQDELAAIARAYVMQSGDDDPGDGGGVATVRVVERLIAFPEYPLTAAQQAALSGLPDAQA